MNTLHFNPDEVAESAMRVFWQKGYSATSIQDLVEATGLSRSSLYSTFTNKHGLFLHALRLYHRQTAANAALLAQAGSATELVYRLLRTIADQELANESCFGCLVANTSLELGGRDDVVTEAVGKHFSTLEAALAALMQRGQLQGEIPPGKSPLALARFLVATIQGLRVVGRGQIDADQPERLEQIIATSLEALS